MEILFHRQATREYPAALRRYDRITSRLGDRFVAAVSTAVGKILVNPNSPPVELGPFRRVRLRKFPYALFFAIISADTIGVVAVAHTSRRAGYWRRRRFDNP